MYLLTAFHSYSLSISFPVFVGVTFLKLSIIVLYLVLLRKRKYQDIILNTVGKPLITIIGELFRRYTVKLELPKLIL